MEKLLTTEPAVFERFLKSSADPARSEADDRQAYHYLSVRFPLCDLILVL